MDEIYRWAVSAVGALLGALYLKNERELTRLSRNAHDDRGSVTPLSLFNAHVKEDERIHDETREARRELIDLIKDLDRKVDELLMRRKA